MRKKDNTITTTLHGSTTSWRAPKLPAVHSRDRDGPGGATLDSGSGGRTGQCNYNHPFIGCISGMLSSTIPQRFGPHDLEHVLSSR